MRTNRCVLNRALIPVLVPMFLIISSSIFPAIISSIEDKEILIISKVMAQLKETNTGTSNYRSTLMIPSSQDLISSSPTPVEEAFSGTSSASEVSNAALTPITTRQQDEVDNKMAATEINPEDLVHTVWLDIAPGNLDIFYKRDGADYDPTTINLSNDASQSNEPAVAVSGNTVHIVWPDTATTDILYRRSANSGASFGPIINLSNNAGGSFFPAIAVSGNNVHVVWHDTTPGNDDIFYKRSTDGGASFTDPIKNLSDNTGGSFGPAIAASGNSVHVVWYDDTPGNFDILYRRSTDGGTSFTDPIKNLSGNVGSSSGPAIAVSGNSIHVVWNDNTPGNFDIFYRRSLDGGTTFPNIIKNLSSNAGASFTPAVAVSGNNVHVVWEDDTPGNEDILYRRSLDGGSTFPNLIKNLSGDPANAFTPDIAISGNNVYVVWQQDGDILYRTSANNGATFPNVMTNLSANVGTSDRPTIAVS